jgi:hypothetical protein
VSETDKIKVAQGRMRVRAWPVLEMAVEDGLKYGYQRAFKYSDDPDDEYVLEALHQAVMNCISEWFTFEDEFDRE